MLNQDTKRKIDSCRDILVGKVPDPKAQVEQITIALIYKFMDDMDNESIELGGKARFFTADYEKYSWSSLMDSRTGGFDRLNTYSEALIKMSQNPNLPQLFRDIFNGAFLPYRDPETLNLFLKEINGFGYDHSERLGDAFEYLLSVLGSQGEAGQFRTPRHIIDFIVSAIDPKKDETILDPACGTAGFLISAYKHILNQNKEKHPGDKLTPEEKSRIMGHCVGYDISPDMVRLSRVNMYLHNFPTPRIFEYDTLTSEEKWGESYDVILANPPFMTPKGGIRPHKRFSVQAKRSEVLFVDYIAEHLNVHGRAGVIVPEGIIFQSANAYKALRKMLVEENYLFAVVSLPAGVFNPYSGVKTSILLMDKTLAKKSKDILFVKVENDGFDLGAQRRPISENDIPRILDIVLKYKQEVAKGEEPIVQEEDKTYAHIVAKEKIADKGEYNLSWGRYQVSAVGINQKWPMVELLELIDTITPPEKIQKSDFGSNGTYPIIDQSQEEISGWTDDEWALVKPGKPVVIFGDHTCAVKYSEKPFAQGADGIKILATNEELLPKFLYFLLKTNPIESDGYKRHFSKLKRRKIPLPPLEIQEKIVAELDGYQKIINGAKQIIENYKPTIKIDPSWEMVELGEVAIINDKTLEPEKVYGDKEFIYIDISSVENGTGVVSFNSKVKGFNAPSRARRVVKGGDILLSTVRPNLKAFCYLSEVPDNAIASTGFAVLSATDRIVPQFVYFQLFSEYLQKQMIDRMGKGSYPSINQKDVQELRIHVPSIETQQKIVAQIENEQKIINENKKLIEIFEAKIKDKIKEVWGE